MGRKVDEIAKCPHCHHESYYVFYIGTEELFCHECGLGFNIETKMVLTITSSKKYCTCICGETREYLNCFKLTKDGEIEKSYTKASPCSCKIEVNNKQDFEEYYMSESIY